MDFYPEPQFERKNWMSLNGIWDASIGKDKFKIQLIDVVYVEKKNNDFIVRRPVGDICSIGTESNIFNNENYSFVHKSKAWDYEQECRLIVSIEKEKLKDLADYKKIEYQRFAVAEEQEMDSQVNDHTIERNQAIQHHRCRRR